MAQKARYLAMTAMAAALTLAGCAETPRGGDVDPSGNAAPQATAPQAADTAASPPPLPYPVVTDEPVAPIGTLAPILAFTARGNEPFWRVQVEGGALAYSTPELQPGKVLQAQRTDDAGGVVFAGDDAGQAFTLTITDAPCQDSMSGEAFEFTATFRHGDQAMDGCARRGR